MTHYTYDALNRLTAVIYPDSPVENITYTYDDITNGNYGIGRLTGIRDASGSTHYVYNYRGRVIQKNSTINGLSITISYGYNPAGHLVRITYPSGRIVHYQRDPLGRITGVSTQADAQAPEHIIATDFAYLPFGPVTEFTYGNNLLYTRTFDRDYRITSIQVGGFAPMMERLYQYDAVNNITRINNSQNTDLSQTFSYGPLNRLTEAFSFANNMLNYTYDAVGNRTEKIHNGTSEVYSYGTDSHYLLQRGEHQYQYDAVGNTIHNGTYAFSYSARNRLTQVLQNDVVIAEYAYNALGQRVSKRAGGTDATDYAALAAEQEVLAEQCRQQAATAQTQSDTLLSQAQSDRQQAQSLQRQTIDLRTQAEQMHIEADLKEAEVQIEAARAQRKAQAWQDRAARMEQRIVEPPRHFWQRITNVIFRWIANAFEARAQFYQDRVGELYAEVDALRAEARATDNEADRLEQQTNQLIVSARQAEAEAQGLQTEAEALAAQAEDAQAQAEKYRQLAENPSPTQSTIIFFYNETGQLIGEYTASGETIREYIYLNTMPLALASNSQVYYYHNDHLSTPKLLTDNMQRVVWQASHTPFGKANIVVEKITNNLRFPGQYFDSETRLHYNYFRYYDPSTGRYITSDPIGLRGGLNTYTYVNGNSLQFIDPFGLARFGFRPLGGAEDQYNDPDGSSNHHLAHEQLWYDDKPNENVGFFGGDGSGGGPKYCGEDGEIRPDYGHSRDEYDFFGPVYDDDLMRQALDDVREDWEDDSYCLIGHNCQHFADALREKYNRLANPQTCYVTRYGLVCD